MTAERALLFCCRHVVYSDVEQYASIRMTSTLLVHIAKMLTRLSILWEFKEHGHLYGKQIAEDMLNSFSFRDKVYLFMHRNKHARWRTVALGVLWNRCVRYLARVRKWLQLM